MKERWKPIPGWEGFYEVSDRGEVRSLDRTFMRSHGESYRLCGRILKPFWHKGYGFVSLSRGGETARQPIHHLVAAAFIGPRDSTQVHVRHLNDVRADNRAENIAYGSSSDNMHDAIRNGRHSNAGKTHCPYGHPLRAPNLAKPPKSATGSHRACLACGRTRAYIQRNPAQKKNHQIISDRVHAEILKKEKEAA